MNLSPGARSGLWVLGGWFVAVAIVGALLALEVQWGRASSTWTNLMFALWPAALLGSARAGHGTLADGWQVWTIAVALNGVTYGGLSFLWNLRHQTRRVVRILIIAGVLAWWGLLVWMTVAAGNDAGRQLIA